MKLAVVATHPIQYYAPWFRYLATRIDLHVFYAHQQNAKGQGDAGFAIEFNWDIPLLDGYSYRWLTNVSRCPSVDHFAGCDTPELFKLLQRKDFDACLILGWNRKCYLQAAAACVRHRIPILVRGDSHLGTPRGRIHRLGKYLPYRLLLPSCGAHLYVGKRNRDYLRYYGVPESKLFFSPHCVDNEFFSLEAHRARSQGRTLQLRSQLGIRQTDFVALFVGKMIKLKRPADLLDACCIVNNASTESNVHSVFVGDGPLRNDLMYQANTLGDRIHFVGFRNQGEMPVWYAAADILVLPSANETWGLVVNEAMACGVPVVVSEAVGCAIDLIDERQTGYTYPVGDARQLASRIAQLRSQLRDKSCTMRDAIAATMRQYSFLGATAGLLDALEYVKQHRKTFV